MNIPYSVQIFGIDFSSIRSTLLYRVNYKFIIAVYKITCQRLKIMIAKDQRKKNYNQLKRLINNAVHDGFYDVIHNTYGSCIHRNAEKSVNNRRFVHYKQFMEFNAYCDYFYERFFTVFNCVERFFFLRVQHQLATILNGNSF